MTSEKNVAAGINAGILILLIIISGCLRPEGAVKVNLSNRTMDAGYNFDTESLRIAVSAIISPEETLVYYQDMFDYLSLKLDIPVKLVQRKTYQETNDLVRRNSVDAAFVCSLAYVEGNEQFGMEILAVPLVKGEPYYYSYIIVPSDSDITSLKELKGKTFAFSDLLSNSGKLSPEYMIAKMGENPETFFKLTFFTYSHDKSIQAVAEKMVDGAAVDSLVWDYKNIKDPRLTSRTRTISKSPPYGIPPVVVSKDLDPMLKDRLKNILLHMHEDERGREILNRVMIDRFSEANDSNYDSIREMKKVVDEAKK